MSGALYGKQAPRNYYPMPNAVFSLGLRPGELAVYSYLIYVEDRRTFQCYVLWLPKEATQRERLHDRAARAVQN